MSGALALGAGGLAAEGGVAALEVLSGPVGWAILAGTVIVGGAALYHAHQQSQAQLKDSAQDRPCAECGEVDCFNTPDGGDSAEMDKQLKEQEDAINSKSPDEILKNLDKFDEEGRPDDSAERAAARQVAKVRAGDAASEAARASGKSLAEADAAGNAAAEAAGAGKDVTHTLDWVAGGDGAISGLGDSKINRSIGAQWKRIRNSLRKAAEAAKKAGKKTMDVKLKKC